jgi:V-type H+-transporting ATPase subunit H
VFFLVQNWIGNGVYLFGLRTDVPGFADSLLALEQPFDLLLALLDNTRDPIPVLSAAISTTLITVSLASSTNPKNLDPRVKDALPRFYRYLAGVSKSAADHQQQDLAIQSIVALLRSLHGKRAFWELQDVTVQPLVETLEAAAKGTAGSHSGSSDSIAPTSNIAIGASSIMVIVQGGVPLQLLYHVLLVIWQLTFEDTISEEINRWVADVCLYLLLAPPGSNKININGFI